MFHTVNHQKHSPYLSSAFLGISHKSTNSPSIKLMRNCQSQYQLHSHPISVSLHFFSQQPPVIHFFLKKKDYFWQWRLGRAINKLIQCGRTPWNVHSSQKSRKLFPIQWTGKRRLISNIQNSSFVFNSTFANYLLQYFLLNLSESEVNWLSCANPGLVQMPQVEGSSDLLKHLSISLGMQKHYDSYNYNLIYYLLQNKFFAE